MKQAYEAPKLVEIGKISAVTLGGSGAAADCGNTGMNNGKRPDQSSSCPPQSPTGGL
ncbi:MAG: lasso RiPP family leader peptide-containing protein [Thermomicrobiales bacterium]